MMNGQNTMNDDFGRLHANDGLISVSVKEGRACISFPNHLKKHIISIWRNYLIIKLGWLTHKIMRCFMKKSQKCGSQLQIGID